MPKEGYGSKIDVGRDVDFFISEMFTKSVSTGSFDLKCAAREKKMVYNREKRKEGAYENPDGGRRHDDSRGRE